MDTRVFSRPVEHHEEEIRFEPDERHRVAQLVQSQAPGDHVFVLDRVEILVVDVQ